MARTFAAGTAIAVAAMTACWVVATWRRDTSLVDRIWGVVLAAVATSDAWLGTGTPHRRALLLAVVWLWGLRLSGYVTVRNWGRGEDPRYAALRHRHPRGWTWRSLVVVFWFQAAAARVVTLPVWAASHGTAPLGGWDAAGLLLAAAGLTVETVADLQLWRHRQQRPGTILDRGLWAVCRHPNYLGELAFWWGLWLVAVGAGGAWTVVGPLALTVLVRYVTGVAPTEARMARRAGWAAYAARTPLLLPRWPTRRP